MTIKVEKKSFQNTNFLDAGQIRIGLLGMMVLGERKIIESNNNSSQGAAFYKSGEEFQRLTNPISSSWPHQKTTVPILPCSYIGAMQLSSGHWYEKEVMLSVF